MSGNTTRLGSANTYDNAVRQLTARQSQMSSLQEQLTAGKKVLRPSDDPSGAAQAERAITRMARVTTDQRALEVQRNAVGTAESTLGDAITAVQTFRALAVQAGNTSLTGTDRASIAQQMTTLRDQILGYANEKDSNGQPLFGGLGSTAAPFSDTSGGVTFNGIAGQTAGGAVSVPATLDGAATWMNVPTGNGVFAITQASGTSTVYTDAGKVTDPSAVTGANYNIVFTVSGGATTYNVLNTTAGTTVQSAQPYRQGQAIAFDGISLTPSGTPANGATLQVKPSTRSGLFGVLDAAIAGIRDATSTGAVAQNVSQALVQIDSGLSRLQSSRGTAGDLLNRVDDISGRQADRSIQLEADRSRAEDIDMVKGVSDFQTQQTAYSAALGSYAQIQKQSLFNFIS
ncbi:flagellar hook-associated protein FlgL [Variovorax sp. PAMC28562]|uniref:flagellar hook-associated protein FlgL n=1 Tax=Variovorax sp. PAMC28562 TaxID=2762323 RepID=UPI00164E692B|nr:flagellar hook-associated protein FlgL [Variovorax sp. PAMC28562]QNK74370.1 flagellar hook-associated protein FlgL [Variovorax sp. PAMC28562]